MTEQITLEEALKLVSFEQDKRGFWRVLDVDGNVYGNVDGSVFGNVDGSVWHNVNGHVGGYVDGNVRGAVNGNIWGNVRGYVGGSVGGSVIGKINGRKWQFVETPKEKLQRLIERTGNQELINTFNQLEDN